MDNYSCWVWGWRLRAVLVREPKNSCLILHTRLGLQVPSLPRKILLLAENCNVFTSSWIIFFKTI